MEMEALNSLLANLSADDRKKVAETMQAGPETMQAGPETMQAGPETVTGIVRKRRGLHALADGEWKRFFSPNYREKCVTFQQEGPTFYRHGPSALSFIAACGCLLGVIAAMVAYIAYAVLSYSSKKPLALANRAVNLVDSIVIGMVLALTLALYFYLLTRNFSACSIPSFLIWGNIVPVFGFGILYAYMNHIPPF